MKKGVSCIYIHDTHICIYTYICLWILFWMVSCYFLFEHEKQCSVNHFALLITNHSALIQQWKLCRANVYCEGNWTWCHLFEILWLNLWLFHNCSTLTSGWSNHSSSTMPNSFKKLIILRSEEVEMDLALEMTCNVCFMMKHFWQETAVNFV